jgi:hypothetical protein
LEAYGVRGRGYVSVEAPRFAVVENEKLKHSMYWDYKDSLELSETGKYVGSLR